MQSILTRMVDMAHQRFHVKLEFLFWGDHQTRDEWIFSKLKSSRYLVFPTESYFPIKMDGNIIGAVQAQGPLDENRAKMLMSLIELVVDSTLKAALDLSSLDLLEEKMQLLEPDKNVLKMEKFQQKRTPIFEIIEQKHKSKQVERFCRFVSEKDQTIRLKKCVDTHEKSGNYASLNINDLSGDTFSSAQSFAELGPITVFVPEVSELKAPMQKFFADYFNSNDYDQGPSVIFASKYPLFEPKLEFQVEPELFRTLKKHLDYAPEVHILN